MPSIDPQKVCFVVIKAREFDVKVDPVEASSEGDIEEILEDFADDPTYEELKGFIDSLNEEEQANLVALVWTGRGDFSGKEWDDALTLARERANDNTSGYLLGIPLLPDYLEEKDITPDVASALEKLLDRALRKGIVASLRESKKYSPFIQDVFHDALADKLLPELEKRGILK